MAYDLVEAGATPWLADQLADSRVSVGSHTYYEGPITLGLWNDRDRIQIGRFCWIARDVTLFGGGNHASRTVSAFDFSKLFGEAGQVPAAEVASRPTVIGNDVWIGHGATILPGAQIGDGAMIGARAVVAGTIAPYTVAAGNPARQIRQRFTDSTVERLLKLRWWDWSLERIRSELPRLHNNPDAWPAELAPHEALLQPRD